MEFEQVIDIIGKVEDLTKSPENYLSIQESVALDIRELTKKLYDFNKHGDSKNKNNNQRLDELILEGLNEEQIWQQIDLQNNYIYEEFISDIAHYLVKKGQDKELVELNDISDEELENGENDNLKNNNEVDLFFNKNGREEDTSGDDENNKMESENDNQNEIDCDERHFKKSVVDDKFFKLQEMEMYLETIENKKDGGDDDEGDEEIDYFMGYSSNSDEEHRPHYNDFFDQPDSVPSKIKRRREKESSEIPSNNKRVKCLLNSDNEDSDCSDDFNLDEEEEDDKSTKQDHETISTFEARQERLKSRIKALEEEAMKEKPWQLKGEVTGIHRPQNSLLEEYVEFDTAVRPPPTITEKSTLKLEDIIKQRIKDKAWDDVERKIKPVEDPKEYKKRLVLDQEKSKLSLAQIYEQEFLKQKEMKNENDIDKPEEVPDEHIVIDKMLKKLFTKLDALSNFHFTPKMVTAEVKIVSNLPAITVEEVAPIATTDATLLAPEEIKPKLKGDLVGKTERTKTDKKRERRIKKKKQGIKQKQLEKKKNLNIRNVKDFSKDNKLTKKQIKKLGSRVSLTNDNGDGKYIKSSNAFFTKLQDEVKGQIKKRTDDSKFGKKKLDVKKLKL